MVQVLESATDKPLSESGLQLVWWQVFGAIFFFFFFFATHRIVFVLQPVFPPMVDGDRCIFGSQAHWVQRVRLFVQHFSTEVLDFPPTPSLPLNIHFFGIEPCLRDQLVLMLLSWPHKPRYCGCCGSPIKFQKIYHCVPISVCLVNGNLQRAPMIPLPCRLMGELQTIYEFDVIFGLEINSVWCGGKVSAKSVPIPSSFGSLGQFKVTKKKSASASQRKSAVAVLAMLMVTAYGE